MLADILTQLTSLLRSEAHRAESFRHARRHFVWARLRREWERNRHRLPWLDGHLAKEARKAAWVLTTLRLNVLLNSLLNVWLSILLGELLSINRRASQQDQAAA